MSRIGRAPIAIPEGVKVDVKGNVVSVKGPKGELTRELHKDMIIEVNNGEILVKRPTEEKQHKSLHGLTRSLIANMVTGVTKGFQKNLEIAGVGYRAAKQGNKLVLTLGYSHPVEVEQPKGLDIQVPAPTKITISGINKEQVGAMAAQIRGYREPEPYKGKGIKYEGEYIRRKVGKTGGKGKK